MKLRMSRALAAAKGRLWQHPGTDNRPRLAHSQPHDSSAALHTVNLTLACTTCLRRTPCARTKLLVGADEERGAGRVGSNKRTCWLT